MYAIEAKGLNKIYENSGEEPAKHALKHMNLNVEEGSFFALLGPNGAGKSTFINILAGLVLKTSGHVCVYNHDIEKDMMKARRAIGIVPQELNLDPFFSPEEILDVQAGLYGVPKKQRRTKELLSLVGLEDKAGAYTRSLSGGMLRRLLVAKAMVHNPKILVLDEPTAGVDVELRHMLWQQMINLNKQEGTTIILTTHYLEEAQELCDEIAIIDQGTLIMKDRKENLMRTMGNKEILVSFAHMPQEIPKNLESYFHGQEDGFSIFRYQGGESQSGKIIHALTDAGLTIQSIQIREPKLEDIFIDLTTRNKYLP